MPDKPVAPSRMHLWSLRKIDSAELGGASRVRKDTAFRVDAATGARLVKSEAAVEYADRPEWAR